MKRERERATSADVADEKRKKHLGNSREKLDNQDTKYRRTRGVWPVDPMKR